MENLVEWIRILNWGFPYDPDGNPTAEKYDEVPCVAFF
jgi:hypothetical protein